MDILLDIDGTIFKTEHSEMHPRTVELIENHDVILWSSNNTLGLHLSREFDIEFISKDDKRILKADVLIDDYASWFVKDKLVNVDRFYHSIDEFFEVEK